LPEILDFGAVNAPVMFSVEWRDQQWGHGRLLPYGPIEISPGARALQYGELVFEGLKAYCVGHERPMAIDELLPQIGTGRCSEIFGCGTAAIVMPISALADADSRVFKPRETNVIARRLRDTLLAIQERRAADPFGWIRVLS
jgi:branched-subunit amino acid aminotransferase/4-amino-4-deoxychorismate lyase